MTQPQERTPPQNVDLEMCVLGAIMLEPKDAYPLAADILTPGDFYLEGHGLIFKLMGELHERGIPPDSVAIVDELTARGLLERVGGSAVVVGMLNSVPTAANLEYHAKKVKDKSTGRDVIHVSTKAIESCYRQEKPIGDVLDKVQGELAKLATEQHAGDYVTASEAAAGYIHMLSEREQAREEAREKGEAYTAISGVPSGFLGLDKITGGMKPGELIVVAGIEKQGKSALAQCMARNVAVTQGLPVAIFSMEMMAQEIIERLIIMGTKYSHQQRGLCGLSTDRLNRMDLTEYEWKLLQQSYEQVSKAPVFIADQGTQTVASIRAVCRDLIRKQGLKLIIVDYLQLVTPSDAKENRATQVGGIAWGLKTLAQDLRVPVIALSQYSKAAQQRGHATTGDLRESGAIAQHANIILGVEHIGDKPAPGMLGEARLNIMASRQSDGGRGVYAKMHWHGPTFSFLDASPREEERSMAVVRKCTI